MKQQVNVRASEATRSKLDSLTAIYGTQAEAIAVAVDRLWQDHFSVDTAELVDAAIYDANIERWRREQQDADKQPAQGEE